MPTLRELREQLKPVYRHHTDAVISMIGLDPHRRVLEAAKRGDLREAHAAQIILDRNLDEQVSDPNAPSAFSQAKNWQNEAKLPGWLDKPILPIEGRPKVNFQLEQINEKHEIHSLYAVADDRTVGRIKLVLRRKSKKLVVVELQQSMRGATSWAGKRIKGWRNAAMDEIERFARENNCKSIYFGIGEDHARLSISKKPIHEEILRTYGRVPLQHGFALEETNSPLGRTHRKHYIWRYGRQADNRLWWVKRL